ncbi:MAG TPA: hypothetical protein PK825_03765 [Bacteroidales bacterium]|nr:hypothetical protein [Bacteroidales bacterium]
MKNRFSSAGSEDRSTTIGNWDASTLNEEWKNVTIDLTPYINRIGQYEISINMVTCD